MYGIAMRVHQVDDKQSVDALQVVVYPNPIADVL